MDKTSEFPTVDRELVERFLSCTEDGANLSEADKERLIGISISCQLNPFKREVYIRKSLAKGIPTVQIITGYEVYIRRAEQTSLLDGWKAWIEETKDGLKASVEIRRKDWSLPFIHEVFWNEVAQKTADGSISAFWERMPRFQLKKVAISQGFRLCFAQEVGGFPYEGAELPELTAPETAQNERRMSTEIPGQKIASSATIQPESIPDLVASIHALAMSNIKIISQTHLEWVENQLRMEKTEPQLRGLLKHLQETIDAGGDINGKPKRIPAKRSYQGTPRRPRIPAMTGKSPIPQGTPIF
ncbi:recombinase RecT [Treponema zuelzerae]|uniref:Recombinase RecT n=1 Tax=Teretinema zuelzerae TaxID=156 RepID=A0AAE3EIW2_9SPIR|nr:recombinase RecT [Teretinema zuelzerae]MCD1655517.1 recombinase RecT [Teretinema zuelzerae]